MAYLMCVYYKRELIFTEIEVSKLRDPHIIDDIFFKIEREKAQGSLHLLVLAKIGTQRWQCKYSRLNT